MFYERIFRTRSRFFTIPFTLSIFRSWRYLCPFCLRFEVHEVVNGVELFPSASSTPVPPRESVRWDHVWEEVQQVTAKVDSRHGGTGRCCGQHASLEVTAQRSVAKQLLKREPLCGLRCYLHRLYEWLSVFIHPFIDDPRLPDLEKEKDTS